MKLVYLGLNLASYTEGIWRKKISHPINKGYVTIAFLGRLEQVKGIMDIPLIARKLQQDTRNEYKILIGGDGSIKEHCQQLCQDLGVRNIEFLGWQENVTDFLAKADIFIFTSHCDEAFGLVLLEATACGLPIVAYEVGGVREILQFSPAAYLIPVGRIDEMSSTIMDIATNSLWPDYDECKNFITHNFSIENTVNELQSIYDSLV